MKLVFAHDHVFYEYQGLFYSTGGLSKEMLERYTKSFEKVVVVSRQKKIEQFNNKLTLASTDNVEFVQIPNFKSIKNSYKYFEAKKIIDDLIRESDALIARLPSTIGSLAIDMAKKNKKNYIIELVACAWDEMWNHSIKGKIVAPLNYFSTKQKVRNSQNVVYVTSEFLQNRYPSKGMNTNCSNVSLRDFDNKVLEKRLEKIRHMKYNKKIIIGTTAAVNVKYKGQQYIIEALGKLKEKGLTNIEYHLVGSGDESYLKKISKENDVVDQVKFLGSMKHDKVFEWLDSIDIYTQPSRQEGLPRGLIEAMSRGLPCFGAKTAGIPELLEDRYIFSNTRSNIQEVCNILMSFIEEEMLLQAERNYVESKKYSKNIIEATRQQFFEEFKKRIQN